MFISVFKINIVDPSRYANLYFILRFGLQVVKQNGLRDRDGQLRPVYEVFPIFRELHHLRKHKYSINY